MFPSRRWCGAPSLLRFLGTTRAEPENACHRNQPPDRPHLSRRPRPLPPTSQPAPDRPHLSRRPRPLPPTSQPAPDRPHLSRRPRPLPPTSQPALPILNRPVDNHPVLRSFNSINRSSNNSNNSCSSCSRQLQQQTLQVQLQQKQRQQQQPKPAPTALPSPPKVQQPPPKQELTYQQLQEEIQKQIQQRGAPPTPVVQPPQPAINAFAPASHHPRLPNFPAPHYQFKPPPPPPTTAPPPAVVITDRQGIIDFVPVEPQKKHAHPSKAVGPPAHHSLSGRVGADWIARQIRGPNRGHRASTFASIPWAQRFENMASAMSRLSPGSTNSYLGTSTRSPHRVAKVSPFANMPSAQGVPGQSHGHGPADVHHAVLRVARLH